MPPTLTTRPRNTLYVQGWNASNCVKRGNVSEAAIQFISCSHASGGKIFTKSSKYGMFKITGSLQKKDVHELYKKINILFQKYD